MVYNWYAKTDPARWKATTITAKTAHHAALAWDQFRAALGHDLGHHSHSPYVEAEADIVEQEVHLQRLNQLPIPAHDDVDPVRREEIKKLLQSLSPDKSPDIDDIPNCILQAGGEKFLSNIVYLLQNTS